MRALDQDFYLLHFSINNYPVKLTTDFDHYCYFESELLDVDELNCSFFDNQKNTCDNIVNKIQQFLNKIYITQKTSLLSTVSIHTYRGIRLVSGYPPITITW